MGFPWRGLTRPAGGVSLVCCGNKKKRSIKVLEREVCSVLIEHIEKNTQQIHDGNIYIYNSSATVNMSAFILVLLFWETSVISVGPFGRDIAFA